MTNLMYDWHNANGAEVPHCCVERLDEDGDVLYRVADFYFKNDEDPERLAMALAEQLNAAHSIIVKF